jgi:predicted ATPase
MSSIPASPGPPGPPRWQLRLLGAVEAFDGQQRLTRFPSRAVAALLARVALAPERAHSREELVELLWPGVELAVGRNRLRQALSTLKSLLEPAGQPGAAVLLADRVALRVVPGTLVCDAVQFEQQARAGRAAEARALYGGELMPGYYDEWIDAERLRLAALAERLAPVTAVAAAPPPAPSFPRPSFAPPAWPPAEPTRPLPAYLTRFLGGQAQAARLRAQVLAQRLVTLTGPGGSGKTRLAVELAHALRDADAAAFDLVAFVPLAACSEPAALPEWLLSALQPGRSGGLPALVQALAGRQVLLVLDNLEQLLPAAAPVVAELAAALPRLHLLVTSRRRLGLDGECELRVEPLALPAPEATMAEIAESPAVALFVDRARAARADFHLGPRNAAALAELVRALQGMPLAIELAASRVRAFAPEEMLERLRRGGADGQTPGLDLLARSGPRAAFDARHASMHRVIAWSWEQLPPALAALLAALTLFEGGFSAAAAAALAGDGARQQDDAREGLDELLAHSLLQAREQADGSLRFALYEPIREFAAAQLPAAERPRLRQRLRRWWQAWAEALPATPPLAALRAEMANLTSTMNGALADGEAVAAVRLGLALRRAFGDCLPPAALLQALAQAVEACDDATLAGPAHSLLGTLLFDAGRREEALQHVQRGLELAPAQGRQRARALHALASVRWRSERQAEPLRPLLAEALQQAGGDDETRASLFALQAFIANVAERDHALGEALHRQALALWQAGGNRLAINAGRYNLALCAGHAHRHLEALQQVQAVCEAARQEEDWQQMTRALNVLGITLAALRDWPGALRAYRDCADLAWRIVAPHMLAYGLWNAPRALAHCGRPAEAARLMGFAAHYWVTHFGPLNADDQLDLRRVRRLVRCRLTPAAAAAAEAEGPPLSLAEAVALLDRAVRSPTLTESPSPEGPVR